jgi:hypothetical protein
VTAVFDCDIIRAIKADEIINIIEMPGSFLTILAIVAGFLANNIFYYASDNRH